MITRAHQFKYRCEFKCLNVCVRSKKAEILLFDSHIEYCVKLWITIWFCATKNQIPFFFSVFFGTCSFGFLLFFYYDFFPIHYVRFLLLTHRVNQELEQFNRFSQFDVDQNIAKMHAQFFFKWKTKHTKPNRTSSFWSRNAIMCRWETAERT